MLGSFFSFACVCVVIAAESGIIFQQRQLKGPNLLCAVWQTMWSETPDRDISIPINLPMTVVHFNEGSVFLQNWAWF